MVCSFRGAVDIIADEKLKVFGKEAMLDSRA